MFTPRADVSAKLALQCSTITSSAFMEAHCVGNEQPGGRAVGRATPERTRSVPSVESITRVCANRHKSPRLAVCTT